ncbi:hypothetical protein TVAG_120520 [Trichomonas vaginalis G3]|uniref:Importin N-terminal domain-containing protein n=1 Tax=Trichomonas vaginalis (strain ATCC PRA-98 / G3) TaxID=412133 RepID=A2D7J7_TRIV3|nr:armadillo (ARM) repeat-containing protein family [Trichomonas vaginalis G3]EAY23714.1 hypothetical protein TVAG_120520 [Trichomonas vaginalis G3]KAI5490209.1 armadillo (ARM) repeat-containing protein family [Trichomonas vaginalis G3]|eukprot:XP_001276962.1 hypothetical protein [Trichomonas vaginalis G3]
MEFTPSIFTETNAETVQRITEAVMELQENPDFALILFNSLQDKNNHVEIIMTNLIAQIRIAVKTHWNSEFWSPETKHEIILQLIQNLFVVPYKHRNVLVDLFRVIPTMDENDQWWVDMIYSTTEQHNSLEEMCSIAEIANIWLEVIRDKPLDEFGNTYITKFLEKFVVTFQESAVQDLNKWNSLNFSIQYVKFLSKLVRISEIPLQNNIIDSIVQTLTPLLQNDNNYTEIVNMKIALSKFYYKLIVEFSTNTKNASDIKKSFAEHFKQELAPIIINTIKQICVIPQPFSVSHPLSLILHSIIFYKLDDDFLSEGLFPILIRFATIPETDYFETINNPSYYIGQYMKFGPYPATFNSRFISGTIIRDLVEKHDISYEVILPHITPTEEDTQDVIEAKLYLITALVKALLVKQESEYAIKKKKARARKIKMPPFHNYLPIPTEVVNLVEQIIVSDSPTFLLISALNLYSKLAPLDDYHRGAEIGLQAIVSETDEPTIIVYAAKIFAACVKKLPVNDIDMNSILSPIMEVTKIIRMKALSGVITTLAQKNPEAMNTCAAAVIEAFIDLINTELSSESIEPENISKIEDSLSSIFDILEPNRKNQELLENLYTFVFTNLTNVLQSLTNNFDLPKLFLVFALFSMNFKSHPVEFYESFMLIYSIFEEEGDLFQSVVTCSMESFVWYLYPLVVDLSSENYQNEEFKESVLNIVNFAREVIRNNPEECTDESLPYSLFLMTCVSQVYGLDSNSLVFAQEQIHKIMEYSSLRGYNIKEHDIVGSIRLFQSNALIDITTIQFLREDTELIDFLLKKLNYTFFTTYVDMKSCFMFLLCLCRIGIQEAFPIAISNIPKLLELKERDESEEKEENEENSEGEDVEIDVNEEEDGDKSDSEQENLDDESVFRIICPYHLPFDSQNEFEFLKSVWNENQQLSGTLDEELNQILSQYIH